VRWAVRGYIPPFLRGFAQWAVTCEWPGQPEHRIGFITYDYGIHRDNKKGRGQWVCILGGMPRGSRPPTPDPAYLQHAAGDRQALRVIAQAHQTWLPTRATPRLALAPVPPGRRRPGRGDARMARS
jgi:hypothetical protein